MKLTRIALIFVASSIPAAYAAPTIDGQFGVSAARHSYSNTANSASGTSPNVAASAHINVHLSSDTRAILEINSEVTKIKSGREWEDETPTQASLYSARFEKEIGKTTLSLFGSIANTNAQDEDSLGHIWGASTKYAFNPNAAGYLTLGKARIIADDDDNGFDGGFGEVGLVISVNENIALKPFYGYGRGKNYSDPGDHGKYWNAGIQGSYKTLLGIYLTASYEQAKFNAYGERDSAKDNRIKLGFVIPFGGKVATAVSTLNPLSVPLAPVRAAAYGEILD